VLSDQAIVRFPIYDYYGMKVWIDEVERPFWNNDCRGQEFCFGLVTTQITEGTHIVKVGLTNTPDRTAGNLLSIVSLILLVGFYKYQGKKNA
jgi:hypothetical protein